MTRHELQKNGGFVASTIGFVYLYLFTLFCIFDGLPLPVRGFICE